ncbi:MAG: hypothetical protein RBR18_15515, partial [Desulfovibrionaceae bacterium]|nr:hypothetical protein [Desulfovibrionaceae bacterium]
MEKSAGPDDPQPYLPAPREELKAAVAAAFEHFETRVDTNPFRQRSRRLAKAQAVNQAKAEDARKALGGLKGEIERLETGL